MEKHWLEYLDYEDQIKAHSMNNYAEITAWAIIGFLIGFILGYFFMLT